MCGFAGEFVFSQAAKADLDVAEAMAGRLAHRGPDDCGAYLSQDHRCAIAFRRLAVIDLDLSHQPMPSHDGSAVVAFNGEIYNFQPLRQRLEDHGVRLRTAGDTEVLPELYLRRGADMPADLEGMFAFVIHDTREGTLFMARDRLGQKPLWYALGPDRIIFASEAKALLAHPAVAAEVDPSAVTMYLTLGYVPAPRSIWRDVRKLPAGCCMVVGPDGPGEPSRYWQPPETTEPASPGDAVERVRHTLTEA
ncbi:hypothetical protein LCGC14_1640940, partial [marine sediment metagenome]